jgi:hypothetical protein
MPLNQLASLDSATPAYNIPNNKLDIFYSDIKSFIPAGKTWDTMTKEEKDKAEAQYRFQYMLPSNYQAITGISDRTGELVGS